MNVLEKFYLILTREKNKITPVLFNNTPITNIKDDIFGFKEQVNIIDGAIENSSILIGVIGDYGSGKSSLTEICQKELHPKYGQAIRINMWDTIEENKKGHDFRFLIRSFLYQLAQGNKKTNINFARYINERQSKNYGKLSLTMASRLALAWFFLAGLFFITYLALRNDLIFNSIVTVLGEHEFFKSLTNENLFRIISYPILLFSIIFVYMGIRTGSFVFSLWDSQGKMSPEYGDIFDNFLQIMNRLAKYQWWKKILYLVINIIKSLIYPIVFIGLILVYIVTEISLLISSLGNSQRKMNQKYDNILNAYIQITNRIKKFIKKKKIIYIEDLDRINDKQFVLSFLNELHRFINILPNEQKKRVAFIVSLKSEPSLRSDLHNKNDEESRYDDKSTYSKIFDYTLWIKPIHYENISDIIWELLFKNQKSIKSILGLNKNTEMTKTLLDDLYWIQKGEKLTIREIKDRLNEAFLLYQTLKARDFENSSVNLRKCCAVAYLHRAYPKEYEDLLMHEQKMAELIRDCCQWQNSDEESIVKKVTEIIGELFSNTPLFIREFTKMIFSADIDEDFMMYFYNYPTSSYIKNLDEKEVLDYILHPSDKYKSDEQLADKINRVITLKTGKVIDEAINELNQKEQTLPNIVFEYEQLFSFVLSSKNDFVISALEEFSSDIIENPSKICNLLGRILFYNIDENVKIDIIRSIIYRLVITMQAYNLKEISESRKVLIRTVKSYIIYFDSLFVDEGLPLITKQELKLLNSPDEKLSLINDEFIDENTYAYIFEEINNLELNENQYIKAEKILSNIRDIELFPNVYKYLLVFLSKNRKYNNLFFSLIINNIDDADKPIFCDYLSTLDISLLSEEQLGKVDKMNLRNISDERTIIFLEEKKLYKSALLSRVKLGIIDNFDFLKNDIFLSDFVYFNDLYKEFSSDFLAIRFSALKQLHDKNTELYKLFLSSFPLIFDYEIDLIDDTLNELYMYIDHLSVNVNNYKVLTEYCNKKNLLGDKLYNFFYSLFFYDEENKISDVDCIKYIFSGIEFKNKIQFETMTFEQQRTICENINSIYNLTTAKGSIEFMKIVNCLIPELEEIIINNLDDEIEYSDYLDLINTIKKPTEKTPEIMRNKPLDQALDSSITDKLYNKGYYIRYLVGKSLKDNSIPIHKNIPIEKYYTAFTMSDRFAELCSRNENILNELAKNKLLNDTLSDRKLIYFYKIRQSFFLIEFILTRLQSNTEEIEKYLYSITDIDTESDAEEFINLITTDRYIELLRDRNMFYFLYHKMWNRKMKQKLTFTTNRLLKIEPKYSSKEAGDFDE